jgi:hypothetical protein
VCLNRAGTCQAHAGQVRKSGEPYVEHPLAVAIILAHLRMDVDSLCAGLLHDTVIARTNFKKEEHTASRATVFASMGWVNNEDRASLEYRGVVAGSR